MNVYLNSAKGIVTTLQHCQRRQNGFEKYDAFIKAFVPYGIDCNFALFFISKKRKVFENVAANEFESDVVGKWRLVCEIV